ncbi:unnamed protein product [Protopolystoma xenopodis]|uniref:Uncharacterized protein n=1 Tax=Protopolystoma xenopodis TaxID=117903 RepID=A0A448XE22_9PLAT|nr:unnamed protein product [Protopolystoma xenopodis]
MTEYFSQCEVAQFETDWHPSSRSASSSASQNVNWRSGATVGSGGTKSGHSGGEMSGQNAIHMHPQLYSGGSAGGCGMGMMMGHQHSHEMSCNGLCGGMHSYDVIDACPGNNSKGSGMIMTRGYHAGPQGQGAPAMLMLGGMATGSGPSGGGSSGGGGSAVAGGGGGGSVAGATGSGKASLPPASHHSPEQRTSYREAKGTAKLYLQSRVVDRAHAHAHTHKHTHTHSQRAGPETFYLVSSGQQFIVNNFPTAQLSCVRTAIQWRGY